MADDRHNPLLGLGEALRFLTQIPVPWLPPMSEEGVGKALPWFPAAGLSIGAVGAVVGWAALHLWGPWVAAAAVVVAWGVVTAGLHLDGLSDTFDAVMSWRPPERKLEIMKDSRIGAMGALALAAVLLLKVVLLGARPDLLIPAALLAPVLGRWADVYGIVRFPPARDGGLGKSFQSLLRPTDFPFATVCMLAAAAVIGGQRGLIAAALVWGVSEFLGRRWTSELGGLTGDTYGALSEIGEIVTIATLTALIL